MKGIHFLVDIGITINTNLVVNKVAEEEDVAKITNVSPDLKMVDNVSYLSRFFLNSVFSIWNQ